MVWSLGLKDPWRRAWWPTPVFLPGESQGHRSLAGCEVAESNSTEVTGYACLLARRGKQWIIAREGKNVNIVTSGPCLCHRLGGLLSLGSVAIFHLELGLGWGIALLCPLEHVTTRNSLSILSVLPLPLFFLLFSSPTPFPGIIHLFMHSFTQQMLTKSVRATLSWFQLYTSRVKKNVMLFIGTLLLTLMKAFFFFFLMWAILKILNLLQYCFRFMFCFFLASRHVVS